MATVMAAVEVVSVLPSSRCTLTVGGPGMALPAVAVPGWVVKASLAAPLTVKVVLSALVRLVAEAVSW